MVNTTRTIGVLMNLLAGISLATLAGCQPEVKQDKAESAIKAEPANLLAPILLKDWGPQETKSGTGFNLQPGNISAIWIAVSGVANHPDTTVLWDGRPLVHVVVGPTLVTAAVPESLFKAAGTYQIQIKEGGSDRVFNVGSFSVKAQ